MFRFNDGKQLEFGGPIADDPWVSKTIYFGGGADFPVETYKVYSLADYLPNDNYAYEIMLDGYLWSNNSANTSSGIWVYNGDSPSHYAFKTALLYTVSRWANRPTISMNGAIIPIDKNMRVIMLYNKNKNNGINQVTPSSWQVVLRGYRRLGTNE